MSVLLQEKQLTVCVASDKIWAFKWKFEFWKTFICRCELDTNFPHVKTFLVRLVVILMDVVFWRYVKKCVNIWKISIIQWISMLQMSQNHAWVRDPFKVQFKPVDFTVTENKISLIMFSNFHIAVSLSEMNAFWVLS